jgi:hypothetical protein
MNTSIKHIISAPLLCMLLTGASLVTSCEKVDSDLVEFAENNHLNTPNDTVYSLFGIISKMQVIADRTILLGELRGENVSLTDQAATDLQQIANFEVDDVNSYNAAADYYAIIQNCNFFIANADTSLSKRGESIFIREYAAVKTFRAWTYLQLAQIYGSVPFVTEPLLTEKAADLSKFPKYDIQQIANYFIADLAPYVDTKYPQYGAVNNLNSAKFFIPVRVLLGELCLWAGRYTEAATYYHDYLTELNNPRPIGTYRIEWSTLDFSSATSSYSNSFSNASVDMLTVLPMERSEYNGTVSYLADVYNSTNNNNYYYQAEPSQALRKLSAAQTSVMLYNNPVTQLQDTLTLPDSVVLSNEIMRGDLRLSTIYTLRSASTANTQQNKYRQNISKFNFQTATNSTNGQMILTAVPLYRLAEVYLHYAEALNRAGYPEAAFTVLKYGLREQTIGQYVNAAELEAAGNLVRFSQYNFTQANTIGLHSRGCGHAEADVTYVIPSPDTFVSELGRTITTKADSILYVENRLLDEMGLELCFEGKRFAELMRVADRRNDPAVLADRVAQRAGTSNDALRQRLLSRSNWFLPLP